MKITSNKLSTGAIKEIAKYINKIGTLKSKDKKATMKKSS